MATKNWWEKWEWTAWLSDPCIGKCSMAGRGVWAELLNLMMASNTYKLEGTVLDLARQCRCSFDEFTLGLDDIQRCGVAEIARCNEHVTIISRRRQRETKEREANRLCVKRHREKNDRNGNVTPLVRPKKESCKGQSNANVTLSNSDSNSDSDSESVPGEGAGRGAATDRSRDVPAVPPEVSDSPPPLPEFSPLSEPDAPPLDAELVGVLALEAHAACNGGKKPSYPSTVVLDNVSELLRQGRCADEIRALLAWRSETLSKHKPKSPVSLTDPDKFEQWRTMREEDGCAGDGSVGPF